MNIVVFLATVFYAVNAKENTRGGGETGCKLPTREDTDCNSLIVDCEDQLNEVEFSRGKTLSCLEINTMDKELFFAATESCDVLRQCKCTVAYYIHCKYEPDDFNFAPPAQECFSGDTLVDTNQGSMEMRDLAGRKDAQVKAIDSAGQITYSPVLMWDHSEEQDAVYRDVVVADSRLSVTGNHLVYTVPCTGGPRSAKFAAELETGDCLLVEEDGRMQPRAITDISESTKSGMYAPITAAGTIVANGVAASVYANTKFERIAHLGHLMFHYAGSAVQVDRTQHPGCAVLLQMQSTYNQRLTSAH